MVTPCERPQEKIEIIAKETYKAGGVEYLPQEHSVFLLETLSCETLHVPQEKIEIIAKETYKAGGVEYLPQAEKQIELYTRMGFSGLPICMAKTQACVHALDQP